MPKADELGWFFQLFREDFWLLLLIITLKHLLYFITIKRVIGESMANYTLNYPLFSNMFPNCPLIAVK